MHIDTQTQRVLDLARQMGMLRPTNLQDIDIPRVVLTRLTASGQLEKVGRGLYRLTDAPISEQESLVTIAVKVPQAVFCLLTALQIHELTTQLPRQIWIAMPQGSHTPKIDYPPVKMVQFAGEAFSKGIEVIQADRVALRVYGVAKVAMLFNLWYDMPHRPTRGFLLELLRCINRGNDPAPDTTFDQRPRNECLHLHPTRWRWNLVGDGLAGQDALVVLNCWVTDTNDTPWRSNTSTIFEKSAKLRVSRLIL